MTFDFKCPLCQADTKTPQFKKPSALSPSLVNTKCSGCESRFALRIAKPKNAEDKMKITVTVVNVVKSEKYNSTHYQVGW